MHHFSKADYETALAHERERIRWASIGDGFEAIGVHTRMKGGKPYVSYSVFHYSDPDAHEYVRVQGASWSEAFEAALAELPRAIDRLRAGLAETAQ